MSIQPDIFEISIDGNLIKVRGIYVQGQTLFHVDLKRPLILMRASHFEGYKFWTSMPEGRQPEAEKIGPLIEEYFRSKP